MLLIQLFKQIRLHIHAKHSTNEVKLSLFSFIDRNTSFEGQNVINNYTSFSGCIGYGSYIGSHSNLHNTKIGRFCSIASKVTTISAQHPTHTFVSTHPVFFSLLKQNGTTFVRRQKFNEFAIVDSKEKWDVIIGNDVWIGTDVKIMGGVTIGDGAIIAAGAVVTKDVESYSIVGGIPAKLIRKRFTDEQIEYLLNYRWWDKSIEWIKEHADIYDDIEKFIKCTNQK